MISFCLKQWFWRWNITEFWSDQFIVPRIRLCWFLIFHFLEFRTHFLFLWKNWEILCILIWIHGFNNQKSLKNDLLKLILFFINFFPYIFSGISRNGKFFFQNCRTQLFLKKLQCQFITKIFRFFVDSRVSSTLTFFMTFITKPSNDFQLKFLLLEKQHFSQSQYLLLLYSQHL